MLPKHLRHVSLDTSYTLNYPPKSNILKPQKFRNLNFKYFRKLSSAFFRFRVLSQIKITNEEFMIHKNVNNRKYF